MILTIIDPKYSGFKGKLISTLYNPDDHKIHLLLSLVDGTLIDEPLNRVRDLNALKGTIEDLVKDGFDRIEKVLKHV